MRLVILYRSKCWQPRKDPENDDEIKDVKMDEQKAMLEQTQQKMCKTKYHCR